MFMRNNYPSVVANYSLAKTGDRVCCCTGSILPGGPLPVFKCPCGGWRGIRENHGSCYYDYSAFDESFPRMRACACCLATPGEAHRNDCNYIAAVMLALHITAANCSVVGPCYLHGTDHGYPVIGGEMLIPIGRPVPDGGIEPDLVARIKRLERQGWTFTEEPRSLGDGGLYVTARSPHGGGSTRIDIDHDKAWLKAVEAAESYVNGCPRPTGTMQDGEEYPVVKDVAVKRGVPPSGDFMTKRAGDMADAKSFSMIGGEMLIPIKDRDNVAPGVFAMSAEEQEQAKALLGFEIPGLTSVERTEGGGIAFIREGQPVNQYVQVVEGQCSCKSLLNGHEAGCRFAEGGK
jgi:hypothetical protein